MREVYAAFRSSVCRRAATSASAAAIALSSVSPTWAGWFVPPVDGPIVRPFEASEHAFGPGHRGVDFDVAPGTLVRVAAPGTVAFAGRVAGHGAVSIDHTHGLRTTYSRLDEIHVSAGERVDAGTWLGTVAEAHDGAPGLHFGVIVDGDYRDPQDYLGPVDVASAIHLAPVVWTPPDVLPDAFAAAFEHAGSHSRACEPIARAAPGVAPNDNVAVAIAGIASRTYPDVDAAIYERGPELLGYPGERIYDFSYSGHNDADLHEAYPPSATFDDIHAAAAELRDLLVEIARRHPDRSIDLIAHSQGGIVARTYLQEAARAWSRDTPRVEHVVTFASPHEGAPLAAAAIELARDRGLLGRATRAAGRWAAARGVGPDPFAPAVQQLAPGSELLGDLAMQDVVFGVRALALAIPNDPIVPATHARWRGQTSTTVPPAGGFLGGHEAIVSSESALAVAHRFLRDGPPVCPSRWEKLGSLAGRTFGTVEGLIPDLLDAVFP